MVPTSFHNIFAASGLIGRKAFCRTELSDAQKGLIHDIHNDNHTIGKGVPVKYDEYLLLLDRKISCPYILKLTSSKCLCEAKPESIRPEPAPRPISAEGAVPTTQRTGTSLSFVEEK
jgi:hypothetical protein